MKNPLWHRLLYRAAASLAKQKLVTNPTTTTKLTGKKEWMLTESGFDAALQLLNIPETQKEHLAIRSFEVEKVMKKMTEGPSPENYDPFELRKKTKTITKETSIRSRGFRQAVIESYNYQCCICGLKMQSPDSLYWEVEAAHIVPHNLSGKDDIWNGIAMCRLHHWAFDVGWFALTEDYRILVSRRMADIAESFGRIGECDFFRNSLAEQKNILLPRNQFLLPHKNAVEWHRNNIFVYH